MGKSKEAPLKLSNPDFDKNVFINCPFDQMFIPLLRPLLFVILYLGYNPRIAQERFNSAEQRLEKICELIQKSKFSIHDLSIMRSKEANEYFRLNMPLELGIDLGCRLFESNKLKNKIFLIFEKDPYEYHKSLSDLSGVDIKPHGNEPENIVRHVRNWFVENDLNTAVSATRIWDDFNTFMADFYAKRKKEGFQDVDLQFMPLPEYIIYIKKWLHERKKLRNYPLRASNISTDRKAC
ncbi:MAG: hypothetical protein PHO26_06325 [Dehalococcoidia bacterium]|nr:hypothetical protein [Dehalococcoidia bacterium]MDD5493704.1 hypothetical protein [Dehalococcoidia bacterium]